MAELVTAIVAVIGLFKGFCEYSAYKRRNRIQYLLTFGKRYTDNEDIKEVIMFLEKLEDDNLYMKDKMSSNNTYNDDVLSIHSIEMFMRFIEELELLIKSDSISESAALNLFGHYTTILDKYNTRWPNLGYNEKYWNVFRCFVEKAKKFDYNNVTV